MKTITELSVCALKDALTQGDVSAREAAQAYLSRIEERDKEIGAYLTVTSRQALEKAEEAGSTKCATTVMLGALCRIVGEDEHTRLERVGSLVPPKTAQMNRKAFMLGYEAGGNAK